MSRKFENYITSYDDLVYMTGPTKFNNFISDKYNKVHIELYNYALKKYYSYLFETSISNEFLYELFTIMRNNSDTKLELYNAIMELPNDSILKNTLITLCVNYKEFIYEMYDIILYQSEENDTQKDGYLIRLKKYLIEHQVLKSFTNETTIDDIKDFTHYYIDSSTFLRKESDEPYDHLFKSYTLNTDNEEDELEVHNFFMGENEQYLFILEDEFGTRIGFNRQGKWIIILDEDEYVSDEVMVETLNELKEINNQLKEELRLKSYKKFMINHKAIEIKNIEYWLASTVMIVSKIYPYRKNYIDLAPWWNRSIEQHDRSILSLKLTNDDEGILDAEIIEINYVSGKAKLYSKSNDLTFEVPFEYLNEDNTISDSLLLTNTFKK